MLYFNEIKMFNWKRIALCCKEFCSFMLELHDEWLLIFILIMVKNKNALKAIYLRLVLMTFSNARRLLAVRTVAHVRRFFKKFQRGSVCCVSLSAALQPCWQRESEHFFFCHKEDYNVFFKGPFKEVQWHLW